MPSVSFVGRWVTSLAPVQIIPVDSTPEVSCSIRPWLLQVFHLWGDGSLLILTVSYCVGLCTATLPIMWL